MKKILAILGVGFCALFTQAQQTNVLFIIADDLGIDSLSAYNTDPAALQPPTPTLDLFQANGLTFTRFYAYPTCSPTRGSMMTGRYSFRTGIVSPQSGFYDLQSNDFTLPEALLESGIISNRLAHIGKWHLGGSADSPNVRGGWPHFSGGLGGGIGSSYTNWTKTVNGVHFPNYSVYGTTDNVNDAAAWINAQGTNSWFCWLAFNAPHTPIHKPPVHLHRYGGISDNPSSNGSRRHYMAMVEAMDTEIARLMTHVDLSETTVIFMGDNGTPGSQVQPPFASNHGKGSIYEGGINVPLIILGDQLDNSLTNTSYGGVIHSVDVYSTILDLFGVVAVDVVPEEIVLDSRSFLPVLQGQPYVREAAEIVAQNALNDKDERAVVEGDYKFIDFGGDTLAFYNVAADITETNNLLDGVLSPEEMEVLQSLTNKLGTYINVPHIYSANMEPGGFSIEIGWFDNSGFNLVRASNLASNDWNTVAGQVFEDNGTEVLTLRDPSPPSTNAYYRVELL